MITPAARLAGAVLDATVVGAYTAPGFAVRSRTWRAEDLPPSLSGTFAVTGASSGIGLATTAALAGRGASVRMLCRDRERGEHARAAILRRHPQADLTVDVLDVSRLSDVRRFAREWRGPLAGLVHNAGVLPPARSETREGIETAFATNVLGPFVLTRELAPSLAGGRVVFVSSGGMIPSGLDTSDLQWTRRPWDGVRAYAEHKRAQLLLARRFGKELPGVRVFAMHPGWVDTPALEHALPRFHRFWRRWLRTPEQGADTVVWLLATPRSLPDGRFWFDRLPRRTHLPFRGEPASDRDAAALWEHCLRLSREPDA